MVDALGLLPEISGILISVLSLFQASSAAVYAAVGVLFVVTQLWFGIANLSFLSLLATPSNVVDEREQTPDRPVSILVPTYHEPADILTETVESIRRTDYPEELVDIYLLFEEDDPLRESLPAALEVSSVVVDEDADEVWTPVRQRWARNGEDLPQNKARALTFALYSLDLPDDEVVMVLDSDSVIAGDFISRGVDGLAEYDIVQAKQTIRNVHSGALPKLESMGIASWCRLVYQKVTRQPYQLLGKGFFIEARHLYELDGWNPHSVTEDMEFGIRAYQSGLTLGILDRYVYDLCPSSFDAWLKQKKRWAYGPYEIMFDSDLSAYDKGRFARMSLLPQFTCLVNLVAVPVGVAELVLYLSGNGHAFPLAFRAVIGFNVLVWAIWMIDFYRSTIEAVELPRATEKVRYYLFSNVLTQVMYALAWTIPIVLAIWNALRRNRVEFDVTPK
jgi:cellulose synthase/poly-beta-1,6-N-acetylglucosamine synthase-like glycosyltransferase